MIWCKNKTSLAKVTPTRQVHLKSLFNLNEFSFVSSAFWTSVLPLNLSLCSVLPLNLSLCGTGLC